MGKEKPNPDTFAARTPRSIFEALDQYVIGQDRAKRTLSIAAYNHFKRIRRQLETAGPTLDREGDLTEDPKASAAPIRKSNVLLIGPSGCGKTHLARHLARILNVPLSVVDATEYTEAGYYGKDVEVMLGELLYASDMDVDMAQRGIVFMDEIDKIARRNHGARTGAGSRDIGGEGVQQSLLKLLEGTTVFVPYNITQHWSKHDFVQMDTTNVLFICAGTFTDMQRGSFARKSGFKDPGAEEGGNAPAAERVSVEDLLQYGMIAELVGRLPVMVEMSELTESDLVRVMTEPPDALLKEYAELLGMDGIGLELTEGALHEIAHFARRKKLGARALRGIFEDVMHDYMFEAPELAGRRIVIGESEVQKKLG